MEKVIIDRKKTKVYLSGKITGLPREEYTENFKRAEEALRQLGYRRIVNPIKVWACRWNWLYKIAGYKLTLLYDLWLLMRSDMIYRMPGWGGSRGVKIESYVALQMGVWPIPKDDIAILNKQLGKADGDGTVQG
jgi:hypothetical protein